MQEETKEEIKPNENLPSISTISAKESDRSLALETYDLSYQHPIQISDEPGDSKSDGGDIPRPSRPLPSLVNTLESPFYQAETARHVNKSFKVYTIKESPVDSNDVELKSTPSDHNNFADADNDVGDDSSSCEKNNDDSRSNGKAEVWKTLFIRCKWRYPSSWTRLSSCIVRNAPCFWCCGQRLDISATHRSVLLRLNILCGFFASGQIAAGIFLFRVLLIHNNDNFYYFKTNLWNLNCSILTLGILGFVLVICVFFTRHIILRVNLVGAIRYLWILMWILPLELFLSISLFDYHRSTHVWIRHWWHTESFDWFREMFCDQDTAYAECLAPLNGGVNYTSVTEWCWTEHNSTDCQVIRDAAQVETKVFFYSFYTFFAIWGLCLVVLIFLAIQTLENLVGIQIAENSRTSNIPIWFALPICVSCMMGYIIQTAFAGTGDEKNDEYHWISFTYYISGAIFTLAALLGWIISVYRVWSARDNRNRQIAVILFLITMFLAVLSVASIFVASLMYSVQLINLGFSNEELGSISCFLDQGANSCTGCDMANSAPKCPVWEEAEILDIYRTIFKLSASVAAIMLIYAFGGLRYGFSLKKHLSLYQIQYL